MKRLILVAVLACVFGSGSMQAVGQLSTVRQLRPVFSPVRGLPPALAKKNKWHAESSGRVHKIDGVFLTANYADLKVWLDKGGRILINNTRLRFTRLTDPQKDFVLRTFHCKDRMDLYRWLLHSQPNRRASHRYYAVVVKQQSGAKLNIPYNMLRLTGEEEQALLWHSALTTRSL